jgi:hypothetical protein
MSNAPDDKPEDFMARYHREEEERKRKGRAKAAYLSDALRFFGVETVTTTFDGYGDDGTIEEAFFEPPIRERLPFGLCDAVDEVWGDFLPAGWEINAGSFGTLKLDVAAGTVIDDIEIRDEDEDWDEEEIE